MTNNFCFKPESRVNWPHLGIRKWYWNYPKTSQGGAKESKIWVLRVDFDTDKSSSKNILSNWIFLTIFLSTTKTPESAKKIIKTFQFWIKFLFRKKTRIFLSRFRTHVTYKNFNYWFNVISVSFFSTNFGILLKFVSRVSQDLLVDFP
jgi:hypothetical protein